MVTREPGRQGSIISLGGVQGPDHAGRSGRDGVAVIAAATPTLFLEVNVNRIAAIITNAGANPAVIQFGLGSGNNEGVYLLPNGSFQLDVNFPWTGALCCQSALGTTLSYLEVSVQ